MASISNSRKDLSLVGNHIIVTGDWEDIKDYTSTVITANATVTPVPANEATFTLQWAHTAGRTKPTDTDIIYEDPFPYGYNGSKTVEYEHKARWFRLVFASNNTLTTGTIDFQTLYKRAPTQLKIVDDNNNVASILNGSLRTLLTDSTGTAISTTADGVELHNALNIHLADSAGKSLATTEDWPQVAVYDDLHPNTPDPVYFNNLSVTFGAVTLTNGTAYYSPTPTGIKFIYNSNSKQLIPQLYDATSNLVVITGLAALGSDGFVNYTNVTLRATSSTGTATGVTISFTVSLTRPKKSLLVGLRDSNNVALSTTGIDAVNNALYIRPGNSQGVAQASTGMVNAAATAGVALFGALADNGGNQITTTKTKQNAGNNSLFVHLTTSDGLSISQDNPLPVITVAETVGASAFDIASGVSWPLVIAKADITSVINTQQINLYNLFIYNDYATTVWVKVYDIASTDIANVPVLGSGNATINYGLAVLTDTNKNTAKDSYNGEVMTNALKYNLTVQPGRSRDIAFPGGATFFSGIYIRVTTSYAKDSMNGPGENSVFINGTYLKETRANT